VTTRPLHRFSGTPCEQGHCNVIIKSVPSRPTERSDDTNNCWNNIISVLRWIYMRDDKRYRIVGHVSGTREQGHFDVTMKSAPNIINTAK
jgi:hypothetical protein